VGRAVFTGRLNLAGAAGAADDITFSGGATVTGFRMEGMVADTASVQGDLRLRRGDLSASASLRVDSLRALSNVFHAEADIGMEDGVITIDTLMLAGSGDRLYTAGIMVEQGDSTFFTVSDIRAKHSKLRIVSGGYLSGFAFERGIVLDTLWIDPPVGELEMSGRLETGLTSVDARVRDFDLSSFSTFSGLPAGMSGVGNFTLSYISDSTGLSGDFNGTISDPAYGQFSMDSITVSAGIHRGDLDIDGVYAWRNGVRSGLQLRADDVWAGTSLDLMWDKIQWLELEVNDLTDWLFYVLPLPVRTMGASVSARVEYQRHENDYTLEMQASARIRRLYITLLGIELPNVNFYLSYPDSSAEGYNARFTLGSGSEETGNFSSTLRADIPSIFPLDLRDYDLSAQLTEMEIAIPGIGAVLASGGVSAQGSGLKERPVLQGKVQIIEGAVGVPQPVSASSSGGSGEMPFDLAIDVSGTGDLWFRTSFADIELAMNLRIFTLERKPTVNGSVSAVRGRITLLQRDFQISEGTVTIIQGTPPIMRLNVTAETTVRSAVSRQEYHIVVHITGTAENPEINLSGTGPGGSVSQEDILTLLAAGLTYGEMQQLNSSAIRSEVESVAQSMLGSLLARNIRHEIGLDTFEISPELMADTTSLVLNVGKYVLPDLYVSYKDDVFSDDPGTVSAQYLFSSDFYVEGSTRTTVHGNQEPTLELHYTIRY